MSVTPKASWPWVRTLLHSACDQPDAASVHAQYDRLIDAIAGKLPDVARHLEDARDALIRLVGAVLAEQHDEWTEGRRYLGLDVLARSRITICDPAPEVHPETSLPALSA